MENHDKLLKLEFKINQLEETTSNMSAELKNLSELIASVKVIATELKYLRNDTNNINDRLTAIEKQPVTQFNQIKTTITTCVITSILGAILGSVLTFILK